MDSTSARPLCRSGLRQEMLPRGTRCGSLIGHTTADWFDIGALAYTCSRGINHSSPSVWSLHSANDPLSLLICKWRFCDLCTDRARDEPHVQFSIYLFFHSFHTPWPSHLFWVLWKILQGTDYHSMAKLVLVTLRIQSESWLAKCRIRSNKLMGCVIVAHNVLWVQGG